MRSMEYSSPAFLEMLLGTTLPGPVRVQQVVPFALDNSASILALLTAGHSGRVVGHFGLQITYTAAGAPPRTEHLVLKLKPPGTDICQMLASLAQACGGELARVYPAFSYHTGFAHTHHRELAVYAHPHPELMPAIRGRWADDQQGVYAVLMEYLVPPGVELLNSVLTPESWTAAHLQAALRDLAAWHAHHLLPAGTAAPWSEALPDQQHLAQALLDNAARHHPALYPPARVQQLRAARRHLPRYHQELAAAPRTLVHNDLNPRNTCFRRTAGGLHLCAYDWELARYHVPVYDVVELLCFVLDAGRYGQRLALLEYYRQQLHARTGQFADAHHFRRLARLAAFDFGLHRLGLYLMAHTVSPYAFLPRVVHSLFDTLDQLQPVRAVAAVAGR